MYAAGLGALVSSVGRFVKDRLYLLEAVDLRSGARSPGDEDFPLGRRIFVLSPEGATLQVFQPQAWQADKDRLNAARTQLKALVDHRTPS